MLGRFLGNHYVESGLRWVASLPSRLRYVGYHHKYDLDDEFRITKGGTRFKGDGDISIGSGSYLGRNSFIYAHDGYSVSIGENCPMSHYVRIYTSNYDADQRFDEASLSHRRGDVEIGDGVWICAFVLVTEDTRIGDGAVIGAQSTVTRDIPPHSIAVGNPARVVSFKSTVSPEEARTYVEEYPKSISDAFDPEYESNASTTT